MLQSRRGFRPPPPGRRYGVGSPDAFPLPRHQRDTVSDSNTRREFREPLMKADELEAPFAELERIINVLRFIC